MKIVDTVYMRANSIVLLFSLLLMAKMSGADVFTPEHPQRILNQCYISQNIDGLYAVQCPILKKQIRNDEKLDGFKKSTEKTYANLPIEIKQNISASDLKYCTVGNYADVFGKDILSNIEAVKLPLCECADLIAKLKIKFKLRAVYPSGEHFLHVDIYPQVVARENLPSGFHFQYCLAKDANHQKAKNCAAEACRLTKVPECKSNEELVNLAYGDACCPEYYCKEIQ